MKWISGNGLGITKQPLESNSEVDEAKGNICSWKTTFLDIKTDLFARCNNL